MAQVNSDYAETNAKYIFQALMKMGKVGGMEFWDGECDPAGIPQKCTRGIYMFYIHFKKTGIKYPVYLGKTETSFKSRLKDHETKGVIHQFNHNEMACLKNECKANLELKVALLNIEAGFTMKLVESLFLYAFNFALNKMENGSVRETFGTIPQMEETVSYSKFMKDTRNQLKKDAEWLTESLQYP